MQLSQTNYQHLELTLVRKDLEELLGLFISISQNRNSGYISLALSPLLAFVIEGTNKYFEENKLLTDELYDYEVYKESISKLRATLKIFDDKKGSKKVLVETLSLFQKKSFQWMRSNKNLWQRASALFLQPDMGIYFLDEKPFFITPLAFYAMGVPIDQIKRMDNKDFAKISADAYDYGYWMGRFLTISMRIIDKNFQTLITDKQKQSPQIIEISHCDYFSKKLNAEIAKMAQLMTKDESMALLIVFSYVNIALYLLPNFLSEESVLLRRIRFLTAYHAYSSLKQFSFKESSPIKLVFNKIDMLPKLTNEKKIRNSLAHYGFGEGKKFLDNQGSPLDQIIQGFSGQTSLFVDELVMKRLNLIAEWPNSNLSKFSLFKIRALLGDNT